LKTPHNPIEHHVNQWTRRLLNYLVRPTQSVHPSRLFIIGYGRTGSNLLQDYLNSSPAITLAGEALNTEHSTYSTRITATGVAGARQLRHMLDETADHGTYYGCKILLYQLRRRAITAEQLVQELQPARWIILYRQDRLAQYVSNQLAMASGKWKHQQHTATQLVVDIPSFERYAQQQRIDYQHIINQLKLRNEQFLVCKYEELTQQPSVLVNSRLAPWLGLDQPIRFSSNLTKQTERALPDIILNFQDLEHHELRYWDID
jgi:LPS sulfotransferase NodH